MKIKQLRLMNDLSQKEFAQQFNIAQNTLSQYENELRKPDIDLIRSIANTYNVPTDYLLDTDQICDGRIGEALQSERRRQGFQLRDLSYRTRIPQKDLMDYENDIEPINLYLLKKICDAYDISLYDFYKDNGMPDGYIPEISNEDRNRHNLFKKLYDETAVQELNIPLGTFRTQFKQAPMMMYATAERTLKNVNQDINFFDLENKYGADFYITVRDDSMINANINEGDIVFIKSMTEVPNGKIACVIIDNKKICLKRFYKNKNGVILVSENPAYPPMDLNEPNMRDVEILGLAVLKQSEIR